MGRGLLRLGAGAALLLGALPARASVFDVLPEALMSHTMPKAPGDGSKDAPRRVTLNGAPMYVSTGRSELRVKDLLDHYQQRYPGGVLRELTGKPVGVRQESADAGNLMVVEVPDKARAMEVMDGKRTLVSAGPLRMVYARRSGLYTEYLMAWTDKPLPQDVLDPVQSGDAPGEDLPDVPRPRGLRSFSFAEPKAGYRMAMYKLVSSPEQALRDAQMALGGAGWQEDEVFRSVSKKRGKLVARFTRGTKDLVVTSRATKGDDRVTQLSYLTRDL